MNLQFLSQFMSPEELGLTKTYYFMAGLPRSGSTLLSSILNQNPRLYSGPSSPVLPTMYAVENHLQNDELFCGYPKPQQAYSIISNVINHFYGDIEKPAIIDKNRAWTARVAHIEHYITKKAKIICPVRDIEEILTSMIMMIRRNPYKDGNPKINFIDEQLIKLNIPLNDNNRCEYIAGKNGILGQSLSAIIEGFEQGYVDRFHFVEYNDLVNNPKDTLKKLYEFLDEEPFDHEFNNIININRENDMDTYGIEDMHEVRSEIKSTSPDPRTVLSNYVLENCKGMDIWRRTPYTQGIQNIPKYINTNPNQIKIVTPGENNND